MRFGPPPEKPRVAAWYLIELPYVPPRLFEGLPDPVPTLRGVPGESVKDVRFVPRAEFEKIMGVTPGSYAPGGWPRRKLRDGRPQRTLTLTPSREYTEKCRAGGCRVVATFIGPPAPRTEEEYARASVALNEAELQMSAFLQRRFRTRQRVQKLRASRRHD